MWATHRGLSKPCENRASYPSPVVGSCDQDGARDSCRGLHLQIQEIAEQDWLLAILASTAETYDLAKMIALGTALLAEVADVAGCAFIDGVGDERGSLAERLPQQRFLQVWQGSVAQAEGALAAGIGAKATAAAAAWFRAQQTMLWGGRRRSGIVMRIVTDGVCGD
jgi:hypothetical protein